MSSISLHHRARSRARNTTDRSHARPTITLRSIPRRRRVSSPARRVSSPPRRKPIHRLLHACVVATPRRPSRALDHRRHPPLVRLVRAFARVSHLARVSTVKVIHDRIQRPDVPLKDGVHARVARGHDAGRDVHESPSRLARRASSVETRARRMRASSRRRDGSRRSAPTNDFFARAKFCTVHVCNGMYSTDCHSFECLYRELYVSSIQVNGPSMKHMVKAHERRIGARNRRDSATRDDDPTTEEDG